MARTLSKRLSRRNIRYALAAAFCACADAPAPAPPPAPARALAPLTLDRLLPACAVAAPPTSPVPAFDQAFMTAEPGESLSIGTTSRGYLVGGKPLPADLAYLAVRPISAQRDAIYGSATFIDGLARAARHVADRYPGSVLWAGDVAAKSGGNIAPHKSHASGRDVDLSYYLRDADGAIHDGPEMRWVDGSGNVSGTALTFDAERNWALVEALLRDPSMQVQWIFVAGHVEPLLLAAARRQRADAELMERAARVMQQPGDSSPHADHFHVRIYCSEAERLQGCLDAPPFYPWIDRHTEAVTRWVDGLVPFLSDPRGAAGEEFRFAIERLVRANAVEALPRLDALVDPENANPDPATRALVQDAIDFLRGRRTPAAWARWRPEDVGD